MTRGGFNALLWNKTAPSKRELSWKPAFCNESRRRRMKTACYEPRTFHESASRNPNNIEGVAHLKPVTVRFLWCFSDLKRFISNSVTKLVTRVSVSHPSTVYGPKTELSLAISFLSVSLSGASRILPPAPLRHVRWPQPAERHHPHLSATKVGFNPPNFLSPSSTMSPTVQSRPSSLRSFS